MNNSIFVLLCKMYPASQKLPSFESLDVNLELFEPNTEALITSLISELKIELTCVDVNDFLKLFKKKHPKEAGNLINTSLSLYFTHPTVLINIQSGRKTIFPNYRTLPDIDFDLLIPVFERDD
ncbi:MULTISPECIES: hypothetical protein [unclassified Colwellia]|uniref:hypothetical protein n=1 Tax=unclassified Colwellia TaxID=196834 RepID=UPI0015F6ECA9|nr:MULTISPECIES: hypothetical protein [unclassified Colwellia]MBA6257118.1 hypothetical protein [Colwellia sp. MB3u-28]MBA6258650.1 hypothetical protein [Colwellia sp. MB3u-41]